MIQSGLAIVLQKLKTYLAERIRACRGGELSPGSISLKERQPGSTSPRSGSRS